MKRTRIVLALAAVAMAALVFAGTAQAAVTTLTATGNWQGGTWDNGQPGVGDDAVIAAGITGTANGIVNAWSGTLTIGSGSLLNVSGIATDFIALQGATTIYLNGGKIGDNLKTRTIAADVVLSGGGTIGQTSSAGWNNAVTLAGEISGDGGLTLSFGNHQGIYLGSTNTFTGGLVVSSTDRSAVQFNAVGAAGPGDVTVNPASGTNPKSSVLVLGANDVFATTATLTLNGQGYAGSTGGFGPFTEYLSKYTRLDMNGFNATVSGLIIDNVAMAPGDYTGTADKLDWIDGTGTLTVLPEPATMGLLALGGLALLRRRRS